MTHGLDCVFVGYDRAGETIQEEAMDATDREVRTIFAKRGAGCV